MKNLKVILIFLLFSLATISANKYDNFFEKVKVHETKYFSIIYNEKSKESAKKLKDNADRIYQKICNDLHIKNTRHIPVVITSDQQNLNAYYTPYPYNRIVMYDTISYGNYLDIDSDMFLKIFEHELTHLLTLSVLDDVKYRSISNFIGDIFNFQRLNSTQAFSEGLAVSQESYDGSGRLNNDFYNACILQSKLDNNIPSFNQIQGNLELKTSCNLSYIYGSAFTDFIRKKYGSEKLGQYIKQTQYLHIIPFSMNIPFYKVYHTSIFDEYKNFTKTIKKVEVSPVNAKVLKEGSSYSLLTIFDNYLYYKDRNEGCIKKVNLDTLETFIALDQISSSKYLNYSVNNIIVSDGFYENPFSKTCFITDNKTYDVDNFRMVSSFSENTFVGILNKGQVFQIAFYNKKVNQFEKIVDLREDERILYLRSLNKKVYYISRFNNNYYLNIIDGKNRYYYDLPSNITPGELNINDDKIVFEYVEKDNLVKFAIFDENSNILQLAKQNVSGGLYSANINDNKLYYISKTLYENSIRVLDLNTFSFKKVVLEKKKLVINYKEKDILFDGEDYNSFKYLTDGIFLPYGLITPLVQIPDGVVASGTLGFNYITCDPLERVFINIKSNLIFTNKKTYSNFEFGISGNTNEIRSYNINLKGFYNSDNLYEVSLFLKYKQIFDLKRNRAFKIEFANLNSFSNKKYKMNEIFLTSLNKNFSAIYANFAYSKVQKYGFNYHNILGYKFSFTDEILLLHKHDGLKNIAEFELNLFTPGFFKLKDQFSVYNFPITLKNKFTVVSYVNLYLANPTYLNEVYNEFEIKTLLYSYQIQKSLADSSIFIKDLNVDLRYVNIAKHSFANVKNGKNFDAKVELSVDLNSVLNRSLAVPLNINSKIGYHITNNKFYGEISLLGALLYKKSEE